MYKIDPVEQGRGECDHAVEQGADPAAMVEASATTSHDGLNKTWIIDAAGGDLSADAEAEWARVGAGWAAAYLAAFVARARELVAGSGYVKCEYEDVPRNVKWTRTPPDPAAYALGGAYKMVQDDAALVVRWYRRVYAGGPW